MKTACLILLQFFYGLCAGDGWLKGASFYVDPESGDMANDGSYTSPWRTLQGVFERDLIETRELETKPYEPGGPLKIKNAGAPVKAGDTLWLRNGYHGEIDFQGGFNSDYITIAAQEGHTPQVKSLKLSAVSKWVIRGLTVSPELAPEYTTQDLVFIESHGWQGPSSHVSIEDCLLYSAGDVSGWSKVDWNNLPCNCIRLDGSNLAALGNHCLNVNFGISASGDTMTVERNIVENFAGDGLRGLGNDQLFLYNTVKNCYAVNENHDDGFQSWSIRDDPPRERVVLRGNTIINYSDPNQPFRGTLQGIGCFDGPYIDWIVENNLVVVDHWHGISLYGAVNSRIVNNTVLDLNDEGPGPPWSKFFDHKDGTPSVNCIVRNNLSTSVGNSGNGITDHNIIIENPDDYFVEYANLDFRLKENSPAVDSGSANLAPASDIMGVSRMQGGRPDVGAYEYDQGDADSRRPGASFEKKSGYIRWHRNPAAGAITIEFHPSLRRLEIYTLDGNLVANIVPTPGAGKVTWAPSGSITGIILIQATAGKTHYSEKLFSFGVGP